MKPLTESVVEHYGDLLFDLCESILRSHTLAQTAFLEILEEIRGATPEDHYRNHQRAWALRIAYEVLKKLSLQHKRKMTSFEQMELDATPSLGARLKNFDAYFRKLSLEQQILFLLRDKYGLPYVEISNSTGIPEDTLKGFRQQGLKALESWFWEDQTNELL